MSGWEARSQFLKTMPLRSVECHAGDLLAMIRDGLTEIFGRDGRELGSEHVEKALAQRPRSTSF